MAAPCALAAQSSIGRALAARLPCDGLLAVSGEAQWAGTHATLPPQPPPRPPPPPSAQRGAHGGAGARPPHSGESGESGESGVRLERPRVGLVSTELHLELAESSAACAEPPAETARLARARGGVAEPRGVGPAGGHGPHDGYPTAECAAQNATISALALAAVGLPADVAARPFGTLSQGEQKLALLARALALRPRLLILDEWGQGLDAAKRARVLSLLDALGREPELGGGACLAEADQARKACGAEGDDGMGGAVARGAGSARARLQLLVVSHHEDELPACTSHVLQLERGGLASFQGRFDEWRAWASRPRTASR